ARDDKIGRLPVLFRAAAEDQRVLEPERLVVPTHERLIEDAPPIRLDRDGERPAVDPAERRDELGERQTAAHERPSHTIRRMADRPKPEHPGAAAMDWLHTERDLTDEAIAKLRKAGDAADGTKGVMVESAVLTAQSN